VAKVQFVVDLGYSDQQNVGAAITKAPYTTTFNFATLGAAWYNVSAVATDKSAILPLQPLRCMTQIASNRVVISARAFAGKLGQTLSQNLKSTHLTFDEYSYDVRLPRQTGGTPVG